MLSAEVQSQPLTHRECLPLLRQAAAQRSKESLPWVQLRRYDKNGPYVLCGRLIDLDCGETELFKVETDIGTYWAQGRNVRMCSGDGRCTCARPELDAPRSEPEPRRSFKVSVQSTESATTRITQHPCGFQLDHPAQPNGQPAP